MKIQQFILKHKNQMVLMNGIFIAAAVAARVLFNRNWGYVLAMVTASVIGFLPIAIQAFQALRVKVIGIDLLVTIAVIGVILARGSMKVYQLSSSGREQLLRVVEPGGYEGESLLLGDLFAEALQQPQVCVLKQADFQKLLLEYPQLALKLLAVKRKG